MSSFRAEATGILHGLFAYDELVHHVAEHAPHHLPLDDLLSNGKILKQASIYCDSLSLITRLRSWINYPTYYPSVGISCDADLCLEIVGNIRH